MTTWIFGIDEENPQHWEFAKQHGFWDMTKRVGVAPGDLAYFWQSAGSLLGLVRVTSDVEEMPLGTPMPWNLDDTKRDKYRFRYTLDVIAENAAGDPTWTELKEETGVTGHLGYGARRVPADGERWLWAQTIGADVEVDDGDDFLLAQLDALPDLTEDQRKRVVREVAQRTGQASFRNDLLASWDGRCIITGKQPARVLEAAHIQPYRGADAHVEGNGVLLRADLHRLFDAHLITLVDEQGEIVVRCAPQLARTQYGELEGRPIQVPPSARAVRPHPDSLAKHQAKCSWLVEKDGPESIGA